MLEAHRKEAEEYILEYIDKLAPDGTNKEIYTNLFKDMSDEQFETFMISLDTDNNRLAVVSPNFSKNGISTERNFKLAKELGHNFFQRIWIEGSGDTPTYLTPVPYLVVDLPIRRQAQLLIKKLSVPEDNKSIDDFTGQPTGKSDAASLSYPETQVMAGMGLDNSLIELIKYRGGDVGGFIAMNTTISKTGSVSMDGIKDKATGVESTRLLSTYLTGMHLSNTLVK